MRHRHPDDYQKVAAALDVVRRTRQAISTRHRIIDATGRTHDVSDAVAESRGPSNMSGAS